MIFPTALLPSYSWKAPEATSISSPERPSASVGTLCPSVFASIAISTGATTRISAGSGKLTRPGISKTRAATPALVSAAALYSAMRRPFSEPASRDGIVVVMRSTCPRTSSADTAPTTRSSDMPRCTARCPLAFGREKTLKSTRPTPAVPISKIR